MASIKLNNRSFEYFEEGSGQPLVLVHGSASDHRTWQAQRPVLAAQFRVVTYSRRYHWPNAPIPAGADYSMPEHVDDLEALVEALDAGPAHLVGHSYGAFVCLLLAMRRPGLVRSLVLAGPPAITLFVSNSPRPGELLKLFLSRPRTALAILKFGAQGVSPAKAALGRGDREAALQAFAIATLGADAFRSLSAARLEQARDNLIDAELLGSGFAPLDPEQVRGVQAPALLVNGASSPAMFHRLADRLEELLPDTERVVIPDASHIVQEDNAAAYNRAVLSFLARHRQAAPQPSPQAERRSRAVPARP